MISLAERQVEFMERLQSEDAAQPEGWLPQYNSGLAIYRNNYRTTLIDALLDTFKRTARWVGEEAFHQAAAHHIICHPPSGWTLDDVGAGFDSTLAALFVNDPEVSELAWVEWSMHKAFGSANAEPMAARAFADETRPYRDSEWGELRFNFISGMTTRVIHHDIAAIWHALDTTEFFYPQYLVAEPVACHVYREGERPTFVTAPEFEVTALQAMMGGANFGQVVDLLMKLRPMESAASDAGEMLGRWINDSMIAGIR